MEVEHQEPSPPLDSLTRFFLFFALNINYLTMKKEEYYTEELKKSYQDKIKALKYQKYYTVGSIILMCLVLISMYFILN